MGDIILSSTPIEISDFPNHKEATFLISVLDEYNSNGVLIEKAEGEKYHNTIVGYPIVAYLKYDKEGKPDDFGGHELRAKYNSDTKKLEYYFATHPIGSVTESWIEERDVDGYEGKKDVILIKTKLWKSRFTEYFKVFDELWEDGKIASSWEISASESEKTTQGKRLKNFEFIGNALLGSNVKGAVQGAGVLEVAMDNDINYELSKAFSKDIQANNEGTTVPSSEEDTSNNQDEGGEELMGNKNKTKDENELSALTENDVYTKVRKAINSTSTEKYYYVAMIYPYDFKAIAYHWDRETDSDFVEFTYSINSDDTVSINAQEDVKMVFIPKTDVDTQVAELEEKVTSAEKEISEAGKALTDLTKEKEALETQISELSQYKEKVEELEKVEQERELSEKKEELKTFALEDDLIGSEELETDEKLSVIFSDLTLDNFDLSQGKIELIKGRKAIEKCKLSNQNNTNSTVETSAAKTKNTKVDLNSGDQGGSLTAMEIMKTAFSRK